MSDPKRLFNDQSFGGELLRAARGDRPPAGARARVAGALGLSTGALTTASTAAAYGTALKIVAVSVVALGVTGAAIVATPTRSAPQPVASAPLPLARGRGDEIPAVPDVAEPVASAPPPAAAPRHVAIAIAAAPSASVAEPPTSDLLREVRALDGAKAALNQGDAATALSALDRYDHDFPQGELRTEADVLRVDALLAAGNQAAAKRLANAILARDPASPHARHLRSVADK